MLMVTILFLFHPLTFSETFTKPTPRQTCFQDMFGPVPFPKKRNRPENKWTSFNAVITVYLPHLYPRFHTLVHSLGSQKCALLLDVSKTQFNNWPDDSMSRNMSPHLQLAIKLVVF